MQLDDVIKPVYISPRITDLASLRAAVLSYVNVHADKGMPVTRVSRLYNRQAAKFETSVLEIVRNLAEARELILFSYLPTGANWLLSRASGEIMFQFAVEDVAEEGLATPGEVFNNRLQLLAAGRLRKEKQDVP